MEDALKIDGYIGPCANIKPTAYPYSNFTGIIAYNDETPDGAVSRRIVAAWNLTRGMSLEDLERHAARAEARRAA